MTENVLFQPRLEAGAWGCSWEVGGVAWIPLGQRAVGFRFLCMFEPPLISLFYLFSQNCPSEIGNLNLNRIKLMTTFYKSAAVERTVKGICFLLGKHSTCKGHSLLILILWSDLANVNLCSCNRLNRKIIVMEFDNLCFDFFFLLWYIGICFSWELICIQISSHMVTVLVITKREYMICPEVQHVSL